MLTFGIVTWLVLSITRSILVNSQVIKVGSYVLSQKALLDAPERYAEFVTNALSQAEQYRIDDIKHGSGCETTYFIQASNSRKHFVTVPGTLSALILEDGILVSATIDATIKAYSRITHKFRFIWCFENEICNGQTTLKGKFAFSAKFTAQWSGASGINITTTPTFKNGNPDIYGCQMPWWDGLFGINVKKF